MRVPHTEGLMMNNAQHATLSNEPIPAYIPSHRIHAHAPNYLWQNPIPQARHNQTATCQQPSVSIPRQTDISLASKGLARPPLQTGSPTGKQENSQLRDGLPQQT
jgi:hypothetical protein